MFCQETVETEIPFLSQISIFNLARMVILPPKHVLNLPTSLPLHECHISKVTISCHLNDFRSLLPHPRTASPALFSIRLAISQLSPYTLFSEALWTEQSLNTASRPCASPSCTIFHLTVWTLIMALFKWHEIITSSSFSITELVQMLAPSPKTFFLPFLLTLHILNPPSLPHSVTRSHTSTVFST